MRIEKMPNFIHPQDKYDLFHESQYGYINFNIKNNLRTLNNYFKKSFKNFKITKILNSINKNNYKEFNINNLNIKITNFNSNEVVKKFQINLKENDFSEIQVIFTENEKIINVFNIEKIKTNFLDNYQKILLSLLNDKIEFINEYKNIFNKKFNEYQNSIFHIIFNDNEKDFNELLNSKINYNDIIKILKADYDLNKNNCKIDFWGKNISYYEYLDNVFKTFNSNLFNKNLLCHSLIDHILLNKQYKNYSIEFSNTQIKNLFLIYGFKHNEKHLFKQYVKDNI